MFHLVLWIKVEPASYSIVPADDVKRIKSKTMAKWGKQWYEAKIIVSSINMQYLNSVEVDTNGNIMTPERRRSFPNAVMSEKRELASQKRKLTAIKSIVNVESEENIIKTKSIFSEESDNDECNGNDIEDKKLENEEKGTGKKNKNRNNVTTENADDVEVDGEEENMKEEQDEIENRMEQNTDESNADEEEEWAPSDADEVEEEEGLKDFGTEGSRESFEEPTIRESLVSNQPEDGKVQLIKDFPIYVCAAELNFLKTRWRKKPAEFMRRLMHLLVGKNELKLMTPTGTGKTRAIPSSIFKAVFIYVNKKTPAGIEKLVEAKYRRILKNMCNTMRNPKITKKN